jgi:hypothetical protein
MLLHGAIPLFTNASLATARAILIAKRADYLIVGVCDREGRRQRRSRRHLDPTIRDSFLARGVVAIREQEAR